MYVHTSVRRLERSEKQPRRSIPAATAALLWCFRKFVFCSHPVFVSRYHNGFESLSFQPPWYHIVYGVGVQPGSVTQKGPSVPEAPPPSSSVSNTRHFFSRRMGPAVLFPPSNYLYSLPALSKHIQYQYVSYLGEKYCSDSSSRAHRTAVSRKLLDHGGNPLSKLVVACAPVWFFKYIPLTCPNRVCLYCFMDAALCSAGTMVDADEME